MGLPIPRGIRAEAAAESELWPNPSATGCDLPRAGSAKGVPDHRRPSDGGPCAHVYCHSAETPGGVGDWISERQECESQSLACAARDETLRASIFGLAVMLYQPS